jgi:hypothetical protein
MRLRIKALGLGCLAVLAMGAVAIEAAATTGGHFTSNKEKTTLEGVEQVTSDKLELVAENGEGIICEESTYHGVVTGTTFTQATLTPVFDGCKTTGGTEVTMVSHGCDFLFTVRSEPATKHSTVHLACPAGATITVSHPSCQIVIGAQLLEGVTYTKIQWRGTESLTVDFTINNVKLAYHSGICVFLGTNHTGKLNGSIIIKAWEDGKAGDEFGGANIKAT